MGALWVGSLERWNHRTGSLSVEGGEDGFVA